MQSLEEKRDLILEKERGFCRHVSAEVMEQPKLAVCMILIPIFFLSYFWQLKKYSQGIKDFTGNYLATPRRTLDHAYTALADGDKVDIQTLAGAADVPEKAGEQYRAWLEILIVHYLDLLKAEGDGYEDLVTSAYSSKKRFRHFIDNLCRAEQEFHIQLPPGLEIDRSEADDIMQRIESVSARLRRS